MNLLNAQGIKELPHPAMLKHLDLFSGIGGFALAAQWTRQIETVAFCEIDPFCRKVLTKHWPGVPIHEDIRTTDWAVYSGGVDLITGGFPCQDVSDAGLRVGIDGDRSGLWKQMHRIISQLRPRYVVVENVAGLLGRGLGRVLGDLAESGYDAQWSVISACAMGAPHMRERLLIVAYPNSDGLQADADYTALCMEAALEGYTRQSESARGQGVWQRRVSPERCLCGVANGVSKRVARRDMRLHPLGNSIVPQVAYPILQAIVEIEETRKYLERAALVREKMQGK